MTPVAHRRIARLLIAFCIAVPAGVAALYFINPFGVQSGHPRDRATGHGMFRIPGQSMMPTLQPGQVVFADMRHPETMPLARGELALYFRPDMDTIMVKRIVGLPGETIAMDDGQVTVDGRPLAEPYVDPANVTVPDSMAAVRLAADEYFLLGDNRDHNDDSRHQGPVHRTLMRGKLVGR